MASGILVGTIFVDLVKLHRIEEICGECMVIGLPIENVVKTCIFLFLYFNELDNEIHKNWCSTIAIMIIPVPHGSLNAISLIMPWVPKQGFSWAMQILAVKGHNF